MAASNDWLSEEVFDFDVSQSPLGVSPLMEKAEDEDEDEVFFGPLTHFERCVATIVCEKEQKDVPIERLNAEEQALVAKESAMLSSMFKYETPKQLTQQIVSGKMKGLLVTKEQGVINKGNSSSKPCSADTRAVTRSCTNLKQKRSLSKVKVTSLPELPATRTSKLPVSKTRSKCSIENVELVDHASLYNLNPKVVCRRSGIPTKQVSAAKKPKSTNTTTPSTLPPAHKETPGKHSTAKLKKPLRSSKRLSLSMVPRSANGCEGRNDIQNAHNRHAEKTMPNRRRSTQSVPEKNSLIAETTLTPLPQKRSTRRSSKGSEITETPHVNLLSPKARQLLVRESSQKSQDVIKRCHVVGSSSIEVAGSEVPCKESSVDDEVEPYQDHTHHHDNNNLLLIEINTPEKPIRNATSTPFSPANLIQLWDVLEPEKPVQPDLIEL